MHLINEKYDVRKFLKFSKLQVQSQSQLFLFVPDRNARAMSCPLVDMGIGRGNMEANNISSSGSLLVPASDANTTQDGDCAIKRIRQSLATIAAYGVGISLIPPRRPRDSMPVRINGTCAALGANANHLPARQHQASDHALPGANVSSHAAYPYVIERLHGIGQGHRRDRHRKNS